MLKCCMLDRSVYLNYSINWSILLTSRSSPCVLELRMPLDKMFQYLKIPEIIYKTVYMHQN